MNKRAHLSDAGRIWREEQILFFYPHYLNHFDEVNKKQIILNEWRANK